MERKSKLILINSFKFNLQHSWSPRCIIILMTKSNAHLRKALSGADNSSWQDEAVMWPDRRTGKRQRWYGNARGQGELREWGKKLMHTRKKMKPIWCSGVTGISKATLNGLKEDGNNQKEIWMGTIWKKWKLLVSQKNYYFYESISTAAQTRYYPCFFKGYSLQDAFITNLCLFC